MCAGGKCRVGSFAAKPDRFAYQAAEVEFHLDRQGARKGGGGRRGLGTQLHAYRPAEYLRLYAQAVFWEQSIAEGSQAAGERKGAVYFGLQVVAGVLQLHRGSSSNGPGWRTYQFVCTIVPWFEPCQGTPGKNLLNGFMPPTPTHLRPARAPDQTRNLILDAAFQAIHRHGYQGMRLDDVVAATGLTKGALYHHFPNKQALGYAVVDEIIRGMIEQLWLRPLASSEDPLQEIISFVGHMDSIFGADIVTLGCPVNNLAQEMSPLDEGFRTRLDSLYQEWRAGIQAALERARESGAIRGDIDAHKVASFVLAAFAGCIGVAKNAQSLDQLRLCAAGLVEYLESLRTR